MAITMVLLFAVGRNTTGGSIPASLTSRKLMMIWALLALCLPMPAPDGLPTIFYVFMAPLSLLSDGGHVGPWAGLLWAGLGFGRYFILLFIPAWTLVWLVRRRLQSYPGSV